MGIFSNIMDKIFHRAPKKPAAPPPATAQPTAGAPPAAPPVIKPEPIDVTGILDEMAAENAQKLNWRTSIVDLMKLVGMDSSLAERKELAAELGYTGDTSDSASMNIWLHKQVIKKLSENGGKVPPELLD